MTIAAHQQQADLCCMLEVSSGIGKKTTLLHMGKPLFKNITYIASAMLCNAHITKYNVSYVMNRTFIRDTNSCMLGKSPELI